MSRAIRFPTEMMDRQRQGQTDRAAQKVH